MTSNLNKLKMDTKLLRKITTMKGNHIFQVDGSILVDGTMTLGRGGTVQRYLFQVDVSLRSDTMRMKGMMMRPYKLLTKICVCPRDGQL